MKYVDGFVLPVRRSKLPAYLRLARKAAKIWREYGAIEYCECIGDDLKVKMGRPFPRQVKVKAGETVVFSWISYKSKTQRDQVNAKIMKDPRILEMCNPKDMPFDAKRMAYGGFKAMVEL